MATSTEYMKTEHTKGPWKTLIKNGRTVVADGEIICDMADRPTIEEEGANARLIAAAPELLHALEKLLDYWNPETTALARAAIAKARGE